MSPYHCGFAFVFCFFFAALFVSDDPICHARAQSAEMRTSQTTESIRFVGSDPADFFCRQKKTRQQRLHNTLHKRVMTDKHIWGTTARRLPRGGAAGKRPSSAAEAAPLPAESRRRGPGEQRAPRRLPRHCRAGATTTHPAGQTLLPRRCTPISGGVAKLRRSSVLSVGTRLFLFCQLGSQPSGWCTA